jgi:hypothetical protein
VVSIFVQKAEGTVPRDKIPLRLFTEHSVHTNVQRLGYEEATLSVIYGLPNEHVVHAVSIRKVRCLALRLVIMESF